MKDIYMQFLTIACHGRKRGHENMLRLAKSPYVLKVFNYDENSDSYLMEKCDCNVYDCLLYTSPSPRDRSVSRMPSSA